MPSSSQPAGNPAVINEIASLIAGSGRITFAEFMDVALYLPGHGYYARSVDVIGPEGDFYTSPYLHPLFGELIGEQTADMWRAMGRPPTFQIVELGGNKGLLAYDVLQRVLRCEPDFLDALSYIIVENRPATAGSTIDRSAAGGLGDKIRLVPASRFPEDLGDISGCILSNELIDALPVHLVTWEGGEPKEVYVTLSDGQFVEQLGDLSAPAVGEYLKEYNIEGSDGAYVEVNLAALGWIETMARTMKQGFVLTIDYGSLAEELYSPGRKHGTLMCYYQHTSVDNPYIRAGMQDITSHVNFSALIRTGEKHGLKCLGLTTQAEFLAGLGLGDYLPKLLESCNDIHTYERERKALMNLIDPAGLGGFQVLIQEKGVGVTHLKGLSFKL